MKRVPRDAFALYVALGAARSLELVAASYGLPLDAARAAATRERWEERLSDVERRAEALAGPVGARGAGDRHRRMLIAIASKAATELKTFQLTNARDAIRAAELVIRLERMIGDAAPSSVAFEEDARDPRALLASVTGLALAARRPRKTAARRSR